MARNRTRQVTTTTDAPPDERRRAFLTFTAPAIGAAGFAAGLLKAETAAGAESAGSQPEDDDDGSKPTAHREAFYRRARF